MYTTQDTTGSAFFAHCRIRYCPVRNYSCLAENGANAGRHHDLEYIAPIHTLCDIPKDGTTPLFRACEKSLTEMANLLLAKGADPNIAAPGRVGTRALEVFFFAES